MLSSAPVTSLMLLVTFWRGQINFSPVYLVPGQLFQLLGDVYPLYVGRAMFGKASKGTTQMTTSSEFSSLESQLFPAAVGLLTVTSVPTGASEPKNMIYMSRLGIWGEGTPFRAFDEFLHAIEKR